MPAKTHGDKIDELKEATAILDATLGTHKSRLDKFDSITEKALEKLAELDKRVEMDSERLLAQITQKMQDADKRISRIEEKVADSLEGKSELVRRLWMVAAPIAGAFAGFLLRGCSSMP